MWQQWPEFFNTVNFWDVKSNSLVCSYLHFVTWLKTNMATKVRRLKSSYSNKIGMENSKCVLQNIVSMTGLTFNNKMIHKLNNTLNIPAIINPYTGTSVVHILYIQTQVQIF
jgi:hypothetical protein